MLDFSCLLFPFSSLHSVDIHIHDTYYVCEMCYAFKNMGGGLLALFTVCTFLKQSIYSNILSWLYTILTILTIATAILSLYKAADAYRPGFSNWSTFQTNNDIIVITILLFLLAQTLLVSNLVVGAFKKSKRLT